MSSRAVAPLPHRQRIPMPAIHNVVQQVAARFQPEKVILFGSYVYGHPQPESDVDLLVIMRTPSSRRSRPSGFARRSSTILGWT